MRPWALPFIMASVLVTTASAQVIDKAELARTAAGNATTTLEKVRAVVDWTNRSFVWTCTDYKQRTVDEIIDRKGGNCFEQAQVVVALLKQLGITTRNVREINVQPSSWRRQKSAEGQVAKNGPSSSVFGRSHNDHFWIEFLDAETGEWTPADPTLNVVGYDQWLRGRLAFGQRPTYPIRKSRDMLVPFAVAAGNGRALEPRSERYLITGFNDLYGGTLSQLPAWPEWVAAISAAQPAALGALKGEVNLHQHTAEIDAVKSAYDNLAAQYAARK